MPIKTPGRSSGCFIDSTVILAYILCGYNKREKFMPQMSVNLSERDEANLGAVMDFVGTKSKAAGIRGAMRIAQVIARTAQNGEALILNQHDNSHVRIRITG